MRKIERDKIIGVHSSSREVAMRVSLLRFKGM